MPSIIGVYHTERNLDPLVNLVLTQHGVPKKLMLEIPPYWREIKDKPLARNAPYFYKLAEIFERGGSEIIAGDINRDLVIPRGLYDQIDDAYSEGAAAPLEILSLLIKRLGLALVAEATVTYNLLNSKKSKQRNAGFIKVLEETKPELTIIGDSHAQAILKQFPDLDYTRFRSNTLEESLAYYADISRLFEHCPSKEIVARI